jgi:hypothetical protein
MQVSKYWSKATSSAVDKAGHPYALTAWGASVSSEADAKQDALAKLEQWIAKLASGGSIGEYEYLHSAIREELIEEILDEGGTMIGAITRNRYGALVLNAADVFIADVDAPAPGLFHRLLLKMLGRRIKDKTYHIEKIKAFAQANPAAHVIVYETHSGLRVFLVDQAHEPGAKHSKQLLEALGSDKLYKALCHAQKCYRARLTPKPWRCDSFRPPNSFPRDEFQAQLAFDKWLAAYTESAKAYGVCRKVLSLGSGAMTANAKQLLAVHDAMAVKNGTAALA